MSSFPRLIIDNRTERINQHRKDSMNVIAAGLRGLRDDYIEGREGCNFECSAIHLGTLMKNLSGLNILNYSSEIPTGDTSLAEVVEHITTMRSPQWYPEAVHSYRRCSHAAHQCPQRSQQVGIKAVELGIGEKHDVDNYMGTLDEFAALLVHGIEEKIEGLRLDSFASSG